MNSTKSISATYNEKTKTFVLCDSWLATQRVFIGNTDNHNRAKAFKSEAVARATFAKFNYTEVR
jgi:hypothetical protein